MVVGFSNPAYHGPVPRISVSPLRENGGDVLQRRALWRVDLGATDICSYKEFLHGIGGAAEGNIRQDLVEALEFSAAALIGDDASVLAEHPETERAMHFRQNDERRLLS